MPQQNVRVRPCGRLQDLSQSVLEKHLLRAFFKLGKRECDLNTGLIGSVDGGDVVALLCEKTYMAPVKMIQSYLTPKLPFSHRQKVVDNLITFLATPEFDSEKIKSCEVDFHHKCYMDVEWKFKVLEEVAGSRDMSEIVHLLLKCMLLSYVTKLDLGDFYSFGSCWVARSRRTLLSWEKVKGIPIGTSKFSRSSSEMDTLCVESHWRELLFNHINYVSLGVLKASPCFNELVDINVDNIATGELLWAIGCNCPRLEELSAYVYTMDRSKYSISFEEKLIEGLTSLYGHKKYTFTSFRGRPAGCSKLKKIVLPSVENVKNLEKVAGRMLCYLPHLKELCNMDTTGPFALLLQDKAYKRKPLALTNIDEGHGTDLMEDVADYFKINMKKILPNVSTIRLVYSKFVSSLNMLSNFPKLRYLEVLSEDNAELEFGPNFTNLTHIRSNCRWDEKRLAGFSKRAPSLEVFFSHGGSLVRNKKAKDTMSYPKLRLLKMSELTQCDSDPFIALIKGTKFLTHIILEHEDMERFKPTLFKILNDKLIATIIPSVKKLQCFHARITKSRDSHHYPITEKGLNSLLHGCPDLTEIGNLFHWSIPYKRILEIKKEAKEKNWAVDLYPLDDI